MRRENSSQSPPKYRKLWSRSNRITGGKSLYLVLIGVLGLASPEALALVDMKSANYSQSWTDLALGESTDAIRIERTYNSRSIYNGIFGYGWCSDFETKIDVLSPGKILLTHCGGGMEETYLLRNFDEAAEIDRSRDEIIAKVRERRPDLPNEHFSTLAEDLRHNVFLLHEFKKRLGIVPYPKRDEPYIALDLLSHIIFNGKQFILEEQGKRVKKFDLAGRLTEIQFGNENYRKLRYTAGRLSRVSSNNGTFVDFSYDERSHKIRSAAASTGKTVEYQTSPGGDLLSVAGYSYEYDQHHNLLRTNYPDGTWIELTYNVEKDWVTSFRNRRGCIEKYVYETSEDDPKLHFWSTVEKSCNDKVTNNSRYEFINKRLDTGGNYLQTVIVVNNGEYSKVDFDERGRAVRREERGDIKFYRFDPIGRKIETRQNNQVEASKYESNCELPTLRRVSRVNTTGGTSDEIWTFVYYATTSCRPTLLRSSDGRKLTFSFEDAGGRAKIIDDQNFAIHIEYGANIRRPNKAMIEGIGEINIPHDQVGEMDLDRVAATPEIAQKVLPILTLLRAQMPSE
jgi:hypothetical protein